jgi:hypothetical protein
MKKMFLLVAIVLVTFSSCKKEAMQSNETQLETLTPTRSFPFSSNEIYPVQWTAWNNCTGELVEFSGTGHFRINGVVNNNVATFSLHYNAANIKGVGLSSGTKYVTTDYFNYTNNVSFLNDQIVYQQRGTMKFIATGNQLNNFVVENDWHLTINANGQVTKFYTTGGGIISCE